MRIFGPSHLHGPHGINPPHSLRPTKGSTGALETPGVGADKLEISPAAEAAAQAAEVGEVRQALVTTIKQQIAEGTYETPEKLDLAVDRMLDEIA